MRDMKKGTVRKMANYRPSKLFWYYFIELDSYIRSNHENDFIFWMMNYLRYFSRKSWLVAGDHMTNTTPPISYASVLYFGTACIALIIADLDYLEVRVYIIINAYITDSVTEKICTIMSLDFGEGHRKMDLILRSCID